MSRARLSGPAAPGPPLRLLLAAGGLFAAALAAIVWLALASGPPPAPRDEPAPDLVRRRDPVRSLLRDASAASGEASPRR